MRFRVGLAWLACVVLSAAAFGLAGGLPSARGDSLPEFGPPGKTSRTCAQAVMPGVNADGTMEIDVFGQPAPNCRFTVGRLRGVPRDLPRGSWGRLGNWRCIWRPLAIACQRGEVTLYATNPGG